MNDFEFVDDPVPELRDSLHEPAIKCLAGPDSGTDIWLFPLYSNSDSGALRHAVAVFWDGGVRDRRVLLVLRRLWRRRLAPPMLLLVGAFFGKDMVKPGAESLAKMADYREAHRDEISARNTAYRQANLEKHRAWHRSYYQAHREKFYASAAKRRALEKAQLCDCCSNKQFEAVYARAPGTEVDHVVPLEVAALLGLNGYHCTTNLQVLTVETHKEKGRINDFKLIARLRRDARALEQKIALKAPASPRPRYKESASQGCPQ